MASGVQGIMDLTVPGGGWSVSSAVVVGGFGGTEERRDAGVIKRILKVPGGKTVLAGFRICYDARIALMI